MEQERWYRARCRCRYRCRCRTSIIFVEGYRLRPPISLCSRTDRNSSIAPEVVVRSRLFVCANFFSHSPLVPSFLASSYPFSQFFPYSCVPLTLPRSLSPLSTFSLFSLSLSLCLLSFFSPFVDAHGHAHPHPHRISLIVFRSFSFIFFSFLFRCRFSSMSAFFSYSPNSFFFFLSPLVRSLRLAIFPTRSFSVFASSLLLRFLRRSFFLLDERPSLFSNSFRSFSVSLPSFSTYYLPIPISFAETSVDFLFADLERSIDLCHSMVGRSPRLIASLDRFARSRTITLLLMASVNVSNDSNQIAVKALRYRDRWSIGIVFTRKPRN